MIEMIDDIIQLAVTGGCAALTSILALRKKSRNYLLITCFYGSLSIGLLYWIIYLSLKTYIPKIFYVSDLTWVGSYLFLLTLVILLATPEEKKFRPVAMWIPIVASVGFLILYSMYGDFLINMLWCGMTSAVGCLSLRGLLFARRQQGKARDRQYFHMMILLIVCFEHCLWTASCFWVSDTLTNPYFWFDLALSVGLVALIPAMRKAAVE